MTTETPRQTDTTSVARSRGTGVLAGSAGVTLVVGVAISMVGALTGGSAAAYGALVGTAIAVGILSFGSFAVNVVASVLPAASLLFAMMTYTLQVVLMALVFVALSNSGALDDSLDREWLAGAIIAGTLCWLVGQIVLATRVRIPVYDLAEVSE